ncbi:DUF1818 family protein [Cyanobium sp. CH-040]|uniref:DUF1818 family protein n=1 Tax=Cyanobium sp. CH-040 TaxID=2823708 RepID=UPI0020CBEF3B|nr:DUF1818 family protein [Cyanobium sp. CH-040]MCP9928966.1 DUF1818 family protein [Cyanobium sp. CH-040]
MQVQEGPGWRFCVDPSRDPYPVLIGGDGWAVELHAAEARALLEGCCRLADELAAMADRLMPEERVTLELERGPLWLELDGQPSSWRLRFVLTSGPMDRGVEAGWSDTATMALLAALRQAREAGPLALP